MKTHPQIPTSIEYKTYTRGKCIVFFRVRDSFGGYSNFAHGYPLCVNGLSFSTSEALYQACKFPAFPDIQASIAAEHNPSGAKAVARSWENGIQPQRRRSDWNNVKGATMAWVLKVKTAQNWSKFSELLLMSAEYDIVEMSSRDNFWGAVPNKWGKDELKGHNVLGCLLQSLRDRIRASIREGRQEEFQHVHPPAIPYFYLNGNPVKRV